MKSHDTGHSGEWSQRVRIAQVVPVRRLLKRLVCAMTRKAGTVPGANGVLQNRADDMHY
jgi:hypothetical protein